ncbi:hypothetical protein DFQ28_000694, partial [Apophysomyces sp. BC1034]
AMDSHLSLAQLLAIDKEVAKDVQARLHYMHRRKTKTHIVNKGKVKDSGPTSGQPSGIIPIHINYWSYAKGNREVMTEGENASEDEDQYLFETSDEEQFLELESEVTGNMSGYESDDMVYDYPYDPKKIKASSPLVIESEIRGYKIANMVANTGAGPSLISLPLVQKLGLKINEDAMVVELLDGSLSTPNGVCKQVLIRVGGKLCPG